MIYAFASHMDVSALSAPVSVTVSALLAATFFVAAFVCLGMTSALKKTQGKKCKKMASMKVVSFFLACCSSWHALRALSVIFPVPGFFTVCDIAIFLLMLPAVYSLVRTVFSNKIQFSDKEFSANLEIIQLRMKVAQVEGENRNLKNRLEQWQKDCQRVQDGDPDSPLVLAKTLKNSVFEMVH